MERPDPVNVAEKDSVISEEREPDTLSNSRDGRYHFDAADLDRVQRRLKQPHVQMYLYLSMSDVCPTDVSLPCLGSPYVFLKRPAIILPV